MAIATMENLPIVWNSSDPIEVDPVQETLYVMYVDFTAIAGTDYEDAIDAVIIESRSEEPSRPLEDVLKDVELSD